MKQQIKQKYIVSFSGGIGSFFAAKRMTEAHGRDNVLALFADTCMEDEDLYRFVNESISWLGIELVTIKDGRTPWQVFEDVRFLGNSRVDPCSRILKRDLIQAWQKENLDAGFHVICYGIDWTEVHRFERMKARLQAMQSPFEICAPLCEKPLVNKLDLLQELQDIGICAPRLYGMGFPHNNCGGFCVKAGQAQFALLHRKMPERYKHHEDKEEELRQKLGKDITILTRQIDGHKQKMTLKQFRQELEAQKTLFDENEYGGCGCAID